VSKKKHIPKFEVPQDYFSNFEDQLFARLEEEQFPATPGFRIPNGYFDGVESKIIKKVLADKKHKTIPLFQRNYTKYAVAIAACLVIAISIYNRNDISEQTINNIQLSKIDSYIDDGNLEMDLYELTHYLNDLGDLDLNLNDATISNTAIEEYLMEHAEGDFWMDIGVD